MYFGHSKGATYLVQPLDVVFNAPFKAKVEKQACEHLQENLESYVQGKVSDTPLYYNVLSSF